MRFFLILISICSWFTVLSQQKTHTIKTLEQTHHDFGVTKNNTITIGIEKIEGSRLEKVILKNSKQEILWQATKLKKQTHTITPLKKDVYTLVLYNQSKNTAIYRTKISYENPKDIASTKQIIVRDTVYGYKVESKKSITKKSAKALPTERFFLNSKSNAFLKGGKNRVVFPIQLPKNTQSWYYSVTASREEKQVQQTLNSFNLATTFTQFLKTEKPIGNALSALYTPTGVTICNAYVLDATNASLFIEKKEFKSLLKASRENYKSGVIAVDNALTNHYIGIENPDNLYGLHLAIQVVALVKEASGIMHYSNIPIITSSLKTVLKDSCSK